MTWHVKRDGGRWEGESLLSIFHAEKGHGDQAERERERERERNLARVKVEWEASRKRILCLHLK